MKALEEFEAGYWGQRYPAITQSWRRNWEHVVPFFAFPESVRRIIYTRMTSTSLTLAHSFLCCSGEPVSSSRPTHRHRLPRRDAVKAGRRTDGSARHDASSRAPNPG